MIRNALCRRIPHCQLRVAFSDRAADRLFNVSPIRTVAAPMPPCPSKRSRRYRGPKSMPAMSAAFCGEVIPQEGEVRSSLLRLCAGFGVATAEGDTLSASYREKCLRPGISRSRSCPPVTRWPRSGSFLYLFAYKLCLRSQCVRDNPVYHWSLNPVGLYSRTHGVTPSAARTISNRR